MKRRALFVGVNEYRDSNIRNLNYALSDAHSLKAMFEFVGYQTDILENPAKSEVLWAVKNSTSDLKAGDFFLFYFAGHGWTTSSGRHLLFCADDMYEDLRIDDAGIPFDKLKMRTDDGGFSRAFVLDACRSDFMTGTRGTDTTTRDLRPIGELVKNAPARSSLAVLRSCSRFEHALEIESKKHGLFTLAMMDVLRLSQESGTELLFGETLCDAVTARMSVIAREDGITEVQTPEFAKSGEAPVLISGRKVSEPPSSNLVVCPVCGDYNLITDTFKCRICGKEHLCKRHRDDAENCCGECAEELVRKREEEKRQKEAAERKRQEERKRREEAEHKRQEEAERKRREEERKRQVEERKRQVEAERARQEEDERKRKEAAPFFTLDLSGVPLKMIKVKAGRFLMGSPWYEVGLNDDNGEKQHWVTLTKDYWLGETQVTQGQWKAVMGSNPSRFQKGDNYPIEMVSWDDAMSFCNKLNQKHGGNLPSGYEFSLPTEAQWEYACRAGTTTALNSGKKVTSLMGFRDNLDEVGWYEKNSSSETHPVGQKRPNAWGFYDMHGNVWEWCNDWYGRYNGDATDPKGASNGSYRVIRGGSWFSSAWYCRSARRSYYSPSNCYCNLGFRLALVPVQ